MWAVRYSFMRLDQALGILMGPHKGLAWSVIVNSFLELGFMNVFIQQIFIECPTCPGYCGAYWKYNNKKDGGGNEDTPFLNILPLLSPLFQSNTLPGYLKESVSATPPPGFKKLWLIFE